MKEAFWKEGGVKVRDWVRRAGTRKSDFNTTVSGEQVGHGYDLFGIENKFAALVEKWFDLYDPVVLPLTLTSLMAFPVKSKNVSTSVEGVKTDLVLCGYDDSILVVVTQIGKMGTLLSAKKEEAYGGGPTYTVNVLMGKRDEPFLTACARQLIESIGESGSRSLVLSLGLKDHSLKTLKSVIEVIIANKIW